MLNKSELRTKAKTIRKTLDINTISKKIIEQLIETDTFKMSENIMLFYPLKYEINLLPLLEFKNKNFYLPKINGENLLACPFKTGDILKESSFKTQEPCSNSINPELLDLIFVPALMVDKRNYRLGYGKGFYDRFLETTSAKTITPIAKELIIEYLPTDNFDKKVDTVIFA